MPFISQLKKPHGLIAAAIAAALCLQRLASTPPIGGEHDQRRSLSAEARKRKLVEEAEEAHEFERFLQREFVSATSLEEEEYAEFTEDYDAAAAAGFRDEAVTPTETEAQATHAHPEIEPYALEDALAESEAWEFGFCILIYDPEKDAFVAHFSRSHKWKPANNKLFRALQGLTYILRAEFPERFCGKGCDELAIPVGGGDYPHVATEKLPHAEGKAPTLMFGSAFRDTRMYPNMIAMPMPVALHLDCFEEWAANGGVAVCKRLRSGGGDLVFGDDLRLAWEDLTPQVTSRVSDFVYLASLQEQIFTAKTEHHAAGYYRAEFQPQPYEFFQGGAPGADKEAVALALEEVYDELVPRWKAVALTARAELDTGENEVPWVDIKLSYYNNGKKVATVGSEEYRAWESAGVAVGRAMGSSELAKYKYQIDIAGGGGTTWTGTVEKLAMPGLLFHHVSPTKDYIYDRLKPWKHYVPVRPDLKDLKAKFEWAEAHQAEARRIADAGTAFMRDLGTPEGFGRMYQEDMVEPLRRIIEAYRPASATRPDVSSWRDLLDGVEPVIECHGRVASSARKRNHCKYVETKVVEYWRKYGLYLAYLASK